MPSSWRRQLNRELRSLAKKNDPAGDRPRVAFVGIGNEFKADDLAGPLVIRRLADSFGSTAGLLFLDAGTAPENAVGALRRFGPDLVLLIDAVDMGMVTGTAAWIELDELEGASAFTHAPSAAMLADYLRGELHCHLGLIGIQPGSLEFDRPVSQAVRRVAYRTAAGIREVLKALGYTNA